MHVFRAAHAAKDGTKKVDLRTEAGEQIIAGRRLRAPPSHHRIILRREVARDLRGLAECSRDGVDARHHRAPYVKKSILNFGLPDVAHRTIDEIGIRNIPEEIRMAIVCYEPRLAAASLHIERDESVDPAELKVRYIVRADLTCHPVHVPVEFIADIIETGKIIVNRL